LITTFLGLGILSLEYQIDLDRIFLLNPGQSLDLGDRGLTAFRPPVYDSPATTGFSTTCAREPVSHLTASAPLWHRWTKRASMTFRSCPPMIYLRDSYCARPSIAPG
jgi:hypothetical protein